MKKLLTTLFCFCLLTTNVEAQLQVKSNGNVKIGTENVRSKGKLQITGSNEALELELFNITRDICRVWTLNKTYSYAFGVDGDGTGAIWKNVNEPSNIKILHFNQGGNFGMGINADNTYKLKVNGSIKASAFIRGISIVTNAKGFDENKIDNLCNLKTISYENNIKDDSSQHTGGSIAYGFDINSFEQLYPELVYRNGDEVGIDYLSIIPLLIAKINEQNQAINYLLAKSNIDQNNIEETENNPHIIDCYPNPFDQTTIIKYNLPDDAYRGTISIYNSLGALIYNHEINDRSGEVTFDGRSEDSGLYICTFTIDGKIQDVKTIVKKDL